MATSKIAITLDSELVKKLDRLVEKKVFPSRSKAIQEAVAEKIIKLDKYRLARECAKLNPKIERAMAEEAVSAENEIWPEY
jgi:metal-responsive CopG/Arc/MetJ family transcriptional regulator